ncbi:PucR family transcriptional regulator [Arthrobacter sp. A2-55]|uniref:PucR family transcriptional regulator n=1 Tax=Arthrobacter sp. A2-55 TaxID=2897337 RepID=UPI0021CD4543|nr:PucR family transcriptional regulator [Arthrobacter sp. A2-55]MCU6482399.1 PucR family transcriptional regulator [Arthrobacter sp. A2-55]
MAASTDGGTSGRVRSLPLSTEEVESRFRSVTLSQFLAELPHELKILHAADLDARLRWVEPSELADPTPYLMDGEFVLTAGLPLMDDGGTADAVEAYVARLAVARVCALGFGLTPYHDAVPPALAASCRRHGITLVEVPPSVPFAAIGLQFAQLLESDSAKVFRSLAETNRLLMRSVLSPRPDQEVLATLVQRVPCWAVLVGADGKVRARAGTRPADVVLLGPLLERLFQGSGPRIELDRYPAEGSEFVVGHPLRSNRDVNLGALVIGSAERLSPAHNNIVSAAVGLLELLSRQRTSGSLAPSQLATALLLHPETLAAGTSRQITAAKDLLAQSLSSSRSAPMRVVQGVNVDAPQWRSTDSPVRELLQWRRIFDTKLVEITDYGFAAVTRLKVDEAAVAEVERLGWRLVVGDPVEPNDLPAAYQRVGSLRARARATSETLRVDSVTWSVTGLLGREAGTMLAGQVLAPLLELEPERRDVLLEVLRGWLTHNGSWDATAKALSLHRNSVRRHIGAAFELLERDPNDPQSRADLWIALQYL